MKLFTVIGVRPQFIKAAPVSRALGVAGIDEILVHTGQHHDTDMSKIFFDELGIPDPAYHLDIHGGTHGVMTGAMLAGLETLMLKEQPAAVMVYGDTNSTLAGSLAAAKLHIPVIHVEAGLRSFNRGMPEEINRICTDHLAALLFCSSAEGISNLGLEGIVKGVHMVGDVMADALIQAFASQGRSPARLDNLTTRQERDEGFALLTVHRAENTDDHTRLEQILEGLEKWGRRVLFPVHARTRQVMAKWNMKLPANVRQIAPLGYFDLAALLQSCLLVATDSGGLQKEAYWAKRPCVILRQETEWVEIVEHGWGVLCGADSHKIAQALELPPKGNHYPQLYGGGGGASVRIAQTILTTFS